ncbi:MAG: insulinase family protein [Pseudomonadota bacterium]|nr:insulinase family protein [Pseudomonadota bacterium]
MRFKSRQILLVATSALAVCTAFPAAAQTATPSDPWAHMASDVPVDPAVRFGVLPNGMRYAVMHGQTPPGQAALRLYLDAGSLMENDNQLGLAHFMEHMAFNGTTNIPENELLAVLERLGLAFGADTNAFTGFDQTAYVLQLPRSNDETVDTALRILREQVSEALMDPEDIEAERGVIEGEQRLRDTPQFRAGQKQLAFLAPGLKVVDRFPIGDLEIIRNAPRERFVEFYQRYYRPERATMIAVGDFDVDEMERKIVDAFQDWRPTGPAGPEPDLGRVSPREPATKLIVDTGLPHSIALSWSSEPDTDPDSLAERREGMIRALGFAVLNRRFGELSRKDDAPLLTGSVSADDLVESIRIASVSATFLPGQWERALQTIDQERRRLIEFGVSQAELQREIDNWRSALENRVEAAATRDTTALAGALLSSVNGQRVFTAPQTDLDMFNAVVADLTPDAVNAAVEAAFEGDGPLTMMTSPDPVEGGEARIAAVLEASARQPVSAPTPLVRMDWPYTDFGAPGAVVSRREVPELEAVIVTFANGVELTVKETAYRDEEIQVAVSTGIGEQAFSPTTDDPRQSAIGTLRSGGLGRMTSDEISYALTGRVVGGGLSTGEDRFILSGGTRPQDLELQMQFMAAFLTDPAFRSAPYNQMKAKYPAAVALTRATPGGVFGMEAGPLLAGGDRRKATPPAELVDQWTIEPIRDELMEMLSTGPLRVTMIGDVTVDQAIAATARTLGALPARGPAQRPAPGADQRRFPDPTPTPVVLHHEGPAEQALGFVAWPTLDVVGDRTEARQVAVLAEVVKLRALAEIRERQALAYSPGVASTFSSVYPDYGYLAVQAATTPQNLPAFFAAVEAIARDLRDNPITDDELTRARAPMIEATRRSMNGNAWWIGQLIDVGIRPETVRETLDTLPDLESVTPGTIQTLARRYLRPETAWRTTVVSKAANPAD